MASQPQLASSIVGANRLGLGKTFACECPAQLVNCIAFTCQSAVSPETVARWRMALQRR